MGTWRAKISPSSFLRLEPLDAVQLLLARPGTGRPIHDHAGPLERDQAASDHLVQLRKDGLNRLFRLHDLEDQRQVEGQPQHLVGVHLAARAEARDAAQHRGAGQSLLAKLLEQRLVQGLAVVLVALADEDPHERALAGKQMGHVNLLSVRNAECGMRNAELKGEVVRHDAHLDIPHSALRTHSSLPASASPATVASMHPKTVPPAYRPARQYSPSVSSATVS